MRFYTNQHPFACGIDLDARSMYVCSVRPDGAIVLHRTMPAAPAPLRQALAPSRDALVVAVACLFTWYWLAALCAAAGRAFVLGQALSLKALHGGTAHNDKSASHKIAILLRGGLLPPASGYPAEMRATRALLRRRTPLRRQRSALLAPVQHTHRPSTLPEMGTKSADKAKRDGVAERCAAPAGPKTMAVALALLP
jgi:hypothetical protein